MTGLGKWRPSSAMMAVLEMAARAHGLMPDDIIGPSRLRRIVRARHAAIWALRARWPHLSRRMIGTIMGGRDPATVLHAQRNAEDLRRRDMAFHALTEALAAGRDIAMRRVLPRVPADLLKRIEAEGARARQEEMDEWARLCRREFSPSACELNGPEILTRDEIAMRRDEATRARKARERFWLERERNRYALPRRGRALSEMAI